MRIPEPRVRLSKIPQLQYVVAAGLMSVFAIAVATGISEDEAALLLAGAVEPTDEQRERLEGLLNDYARAVRRVNAETMRARL